MKNKYLLNWENYEGNIINTLNVTSNKDAKIIYDYFSKNLSCNEILNIINISDKEALDDYKDDIWYDLEGDRFIYL